jgi:hypothetical protein
MSGSSRLDCIQALNPDFSGGRLGFHRRFSAGETEQLMTGTAAESNSRFRVEIAFTPDGWVIRDLDSFTGSCVRETIVR